MIYNVDTSMEFVVNTQLGRWGNSLAIRIPTAYSKQLNLQDGMELSIALKKDGLFIKPVPKRRRYTLEQLVANITEDNRHGEADWGQAVGREVW